MQHKAKTISGLLLLSISLCGLASGISVYKQMVVFGDSYSDNGNTFLASNNTYPGRAYYFGHFSDGPTWSEYLANKIGLDAKNPKQFRNYAYGQAQTIGKITLTTHAINNPKKQWSFTIPDLKGEINQYINEGNIRPAHTLYFIFIGTNDFLNYIPKSKHKNQQFVRNELITLNRQTTRLKKLGAKHIIIFNIRDLQLSPLAKQLAKKYQHHYMHKLNTMIHNYNKALARKYAHSRQVAIYNINHYDRKIFNASNVTYRWYRQQFSLKQKSLPCYKNHGNYIDQVGKSCNRPWNHLFYDRIHQTTFANHLLSQNIFFFLTK